MERFLPLIFLVFLSACTKDKGDIQNYLVATRENISPPASYPVAGIDFFSPNDIFVVCHNGHQLQLFKTADGGVTWTTLNDPINYSMQQAETVSSVVYMNANSLAMVVNTKLYRSFDGGETWMTVDEYSWPLPIFTAGKYNGNLVFTETTGWNGNNRVFTAPYHLYAYSAVGQFPANAIDYRYGRISENKLLMFADYPDEYVIKVYDLVNNSVQPVNFEGNGYTLSIDGLFTSQNLVLARDNGLLSFYNPTTFDMLSFYNYTEYNYYSIDAAGNTEVAVGERMISTNLSGTWGEVLTPEGKGWTDTFTFVRAYNNTQFLLGDFHGKLYKTSFQ